MLNIVLMGPPGAGKGTQAVNIVDEFHIPHISTGDMFRAAIAAGTPLGKKAADIINAGNLVPDDLTIALVKERLSQDDCANGYLLDGFPRTLPQAGALEELGREIGRPVNLILNFTCSEEEIVSRVLSRRVCPKCGASYNVVSMKPKVDGICDRCGAELIQRKDDTEEAIKVRLANYHKSTAPLLDFYQEKGLVHSFDASLGYEKMKQEISSLLEANK